MSKIQNETKSQPNSMWENYRQVVYTMSKIQNETKSQLVIIIITHVVSCLYYVKDTK